MLIVVKKILKKNNSYTIGMPFMNYIHVRDV